VSDEVPVSVVRDGKEQQMVVKIAALESDITSSDEPRQPAQGKWGMQLQDLNAQLARQFGLKEDKGALVVSVQPGSPADEAAIQQGDVILEVKGIVWMVSEQGFRQGE
jgi:serine protease Do